MDFEFSKDQKLLKSAVRDFLDRECPLERAREIQEKFNLSLWKKMAELGYLGLILPDEYHGAEGDFIELMIVMEEMGRAQFPSPFAATVIGCSLPLLHFGTRKQKAQFLPKIADGKAIWTLAFTEEAGTYFPGDMHMRAESSGDAYLLNGTKAFVPYAHLADYMLVAAGNHEGKEEDLTVFIVDATSPGIKTEIIPTVAHDNHYEVIFDQVKIPEDNILGKEGRGWDVMNFLLSRGGVLKSAEMLGGAQAALDRTVDYVKNRVQFNRPIGSFQAVQHKLANLLIDIEGLRFLTYDAAWSISVGDFSTLLTSATKAKANEIYERTCLECIRAHGAIGVTQEQDISFFHTKSRAWEFAFGDSRFHRDRIASELEHYDPPIVKN